MRFPIATQEVASIDGISRQENLKITERERARTSTG